MSYVTAMDLPHDGKRYSPFQFVVGVVFLLNLLFVEGYSEKNASSTPLNIVAILEAPYVMRDPDTGLFTGLLIDVLTHAGIPLDHLDTPIHDTYGSELESGNFSGMIGDLASGKYDLAVGPFSIDSRRSQFVTFTQPIFHLGHMTLYKIPQEDKWHLSPADGMATLLKPFSPRLWCLISLAVLLTSAALYVTRRFSPFEDDQATSSRQRGDNSNSLTSMSCDKGLLYLVGSLSGRDVSVTPRSSSGRVVTVVWWAFSLMTLGAYIAGLVGILFKTSPTIRSLPFASTEELLSQTEVKVLGVKNSATYRYISSHQGSFETRMYNYWKHNWDTVMVDSTQQALKMMEEGNGEYAVFMNEDLADYIASQEPCNKMVILEPVGDTTVGFACQSGTGVCDTLNHAILQLQEDGEMEKLREKYFWSGCFKDSAMYYEGSVFFDRFGGKEPGQLSPDSLTIFRFTAAFLILVIGVFLALLVLLAEVVYSRHKGNTRRQLEGFARHEDAQRIHENDEFAQDPDM